MRLDQYNKVPEPNFEINTIQTFYHRFIGRFLDMPKKWIDSTFIHPIFVYLRRVQPQYEQGENVEEHLKKSNFSECIINTVIVFSLIGLLYFILKSGSSLVSFLLLIPLLILTRLLRVFSA